MDAMNWLLVAAVAFVGSHFLLSHPLRAPLVRAVGERGFLLLYSLVAFATLGWEVVAYRHAPAGAPLWPVGDVLWAVVTVVMLLASILFTGSLVGNPALPDPTAHDRPVPDADGVFAITRHPMMWAFALWGACHIAVFPQVANVILAGSVIVLALVGARLQDAKKTRLQPDLWPQWQRRTSWWPFAAMVAGRARIGRLRPHSWAGGIVVWLVATWAHMPLAGWAAGIWRWI